MSVDAKLDRLIEKRAAVNDPEAAEMLWNGSARRHKEAMRRRKLLLTGGPSANERMPGN
jgi:hypothetical protein